MPRRQKLVHAPKTVRENSFHAVIEAFRVAELARKSNGTQLVWGRELDWFAVGLGSLLITGKEKDVITSERVQIYFDQLNHLPGRQATAVACLRRVGKGALTRKLRVSAVSTCIEITDRGDSGHDPWELDYIDLVREHAPDFIVRLVLLALNSGQRCSDLVTMKWSDLQVKKGRL